LLAERDKRKSSDCQPWDGKILLSSTVILVTEVQITVMGNVSKFILDICPTAQPHVTAIVRNDMFPKVEYYTKHLPFVASETKLCTLYLFLHYSTVQNYCNELNRRRGSNLYIFIHILLSRI
jgi:hypothetical protein